MAQAIIVRRSMFFRRRICGAALNGFSSVPFVATASTGLASVTFLWEAATGLSHLVRGNAEEKLKAIFDKQFSPVRGPIMITAANFIPGGSWIAPARSPLADPFVAEMLEDKQSFMAISARH